LSALPAARIGSTRQRNRGTSATSATRSIPDASFYNRDNLTGTGNAIAAPIDVEPGEVQVLIPD
jgi:hypothetical protein